MKFRKVSALVGACLCILFNGQSQNLIITDIALQGGDVYISYDLQDENLDRKYVLNLYSSLDNFVQPLTEVEGDIGIDLAVGGNKRIIWHAKKELGDDFDGNVALELKGKLYIPFVTLNDFADFTKMKRDRPYQLTWSAGRGSDVLTWNLYNSKDEKVHTFTNIANVGNYELLIPKDIKPGDNYRMKITDQNNKEDMIFTPRFRITRRVPLYVNVALISLGLVTAYLLIDAAGGEPPPTQEDLLPDPILPEN